MNTSRPPKTVSASSVQNHVYKVFPNDLNAHYTVFGGLVMSLCDRVALVVSERHSGKICVTASVDSFHFVAPAKDGDTLLISAAVNRTWSSSMEIGVRVDAENSFSGESKHIVSAYFTFVALDEDNRPCEVPDIQPMSEDEIRRYNGAQVRRDARLRTRESLKSMK
ncbi:acyl-CoA thioesterase [Ketobacter alkanivorans]|uniref:Acyl-CoA thioesterase n=1 Tax=Ketobacter alkanivorans TaxID=1917421 RepID=A0A2K9LGM3_9GAMM|nr:acyl-CoA thioesterase [Ketobacter alkanivorans]AUM11536.1 acyl-CoA thioesterase [Ketobacter alkanivorans]MCP5018342.1 acyl-CoA thioesterase [Ketobacter sp.]